MKDAEALMIDPTNNTNVFDMKQRNQRRDACREIGQEFIRNTPYTWELMCSTSRGSKDVVQLRHALWRHLSNAGFSIADIGRATGHTRPWSINQGITAHKKREGLLPPQVTQPDQDPD